AAARLTGCRRRHAGALVTAAGGAAAAGNRARAGEREQQRRSDEHREEDGPASRTILLVFVVQRGSFRWAVAAETLGGLVPAAAAPRGGNRSGRTVSVILGRPPSGGHKDLYTQIYSRTARCARLMRSPCTRARFRRDSAGASCSI